MTLVIQCSNFKVHVDAEISFPMQQLTLLKGDSGAGKSSFLRAVVWCLYGRERSVGHHSQPRQATSVKVRCASTVAAECWEVHRVTQPGRVTVHANGEILEADAAVDWVQRRFGTFSVWGLACLQRLHGQNVLINSKQGDKFRVVREIAFADEDSEKHLAAVATTLQTATADLAAAQQVTAGAVRILEGMPAPTEDADRALDATGLVARLTTLKKDTAQLPVGRKAVAVASTALQKTRAIVDATRGDADAHAAVLAGLPTGAVEAFAGGELLVSWETAGERLRAYRGQLQVHQTIYADRTQVAVQIAELEKDNAVRYFLADDLISDAAFVRAQRQADQQQVLAESLGLPRADELDAARWAEAGADIATWNAHHIDLLAFFRERAAIQVASRDLRLRVAKAEVPAECAAKSDAELDRARQTVSTCVSHLRSIRDVDIFAEDLSTQLETRAQTVAKLLFAHEHASRWAKAREIFSIVNKMPTGPPVTTADADRLVAELHETGRPATLACPECQTELSLVSGSLVSVRTGSPAAALRRDPKTIQSELNEVRARIARQEHCQRVISEVEKMELLKQYKDATPLTADVLAALTAESHQIRAAQDLAVGVEELASPVARRWIVERSADFARVAVEVKEVRRRVAALKEAESRLLFVFGAAIPDACVEDCDAQMNATFAGWWPREGARAADPAIRTAVEARRSFPDYIKPLGFTHTTLAGARALHQARNELKALGERIAQLEGTVPPEIEVPEFPVFAEMADPCYNDLSTYNNICKAVELMGDVLPRVRDMAAACDSVQRLAPNADRHVAALAELPGREAAAAEAAARVEALSELAAEEARLRAAQPWRAAADAVAEAERAQAVHTDWLAQTRKLKEAAHLLDGEMLEHAMDILVHNINAILKDIFLTPAAIEFSSTKTTKTTKTTKLDYNILFHYRNITYDDLSSLSDGEHMRLSWAISLAVAKMNTFPMFAVDESLSTLQPDLRMVAMDLMRKHLPDKALVVVMQDDSMGLYDNVIEIEPPADPAPVEPTGPGAAASKKRRGVDDGTPVTTDTSATQKRRKAK